MLHSAAATHIDSKQQQRERKKRGNIKHKSKIAVCAVVVMGDIMGIQCDTMQYNASAMQCSTLSTV